MEEHELLSPKNLSREITEKRGLKIACAISMIAIFLVAGYMSMPKRTTINFHLPRDFFLSFYDYDNTTIIYESNYSIYVIMTNPAEYPNQVGHLRHFMHELLLSIFLDIELYNMSYLQPEFILNGQVLTIDFTAEASTEKICIDAFDISMWNGSINYSAMDFGNSPFLNLTKGIENDIYIEGIHCFREGDNVYRPYLIYNYGGNSYQEKMAWNQTISM